MLKNSLKSNQINHVIEIKLIVELERRRGCNSVLKVYNGANINLSVHSLSAERQFYLTNKSVMKTLLKTSEN